MVGTSSMVRKFGLVHLFMKENIVQALVSSHLHIHRLTTKEFFRSAYIHKFGVDCLDVALANDAKRFDESGFIPPYVVPYIIHIYGVH